MRKITTKEFIYRANFTHNYFYNYDFVEYINSFAKVKIACPNHGIFEQVASEHLRGYGCKKCAFEKSRVSQKRSFEEFVEISNNIHNNFYDYSLVKYKNNKTKVCIICPIHGKFEKLAYMHLRGSGCPTCSHIKKYEKRKLTTEQFVSLSKKIHGDEYDYSLTKYISSRSKVDIICKKHGIFSQKPPQHLRGAICPRCSKKPKLTVDDFLRRAKEKHNNLYEYGKIEEVNSLTKVEIFCKKHGKFKQAAYEHLRGAGCPKCTSSISKGEEKWLDLLNVNNRQVKLNIDNKIYIVDGFDYNTNTVYEYNGDFWHGNPEIYHEKDINNYSGKKFGELYSETINKKKDLESKGYKVISIWESEFLKLIGKSRI